jgi:hypothetical protein
LLSARLDQWQAYRRPGYGSRVPHQVQQEELLPEQASKPERRGDRTPCGFGGVAQDRIFAFHVFEQRQHQSVVIQRGVGPLREGAPNRAILCQLAAAAFEFAAGPPLEAVGDLAASDHLRICRQKRLKQRRTALAKTPDIDQPRQRQPSHVIRLATGYGAEA